MKRSFKRILFIAAIASAALYFAFFTAVFASGVNDLKRKAEEVKDARDDTLINLENIQSEKDEALVELAVLDAELSELSERLFVLEESLAQTGASLDAAKNDLDSAQLQRLCQYESYKKRVRYQYMNGRAGYLDVIFKSDGIIDFLNRVEYVNKIVETDRRQTAALIQTEKTITEKINETQTKKNELDELTARYETAYALNETARENKAARFAALCADETLYQKQLDDLFAESEKIKLLIKQEEAAEAKRREEERKAAEAKRKEEERKAAEAKKALESASAAKAANPAAVYNGGSLGWPVPSSGVISSGYVGRNSPISGKAEFHTGVDIAAKYGADVVAAEGGTVIFAGVSGGYGNTVIISHGNSLSTLYAHNSALCVVTGQTVSRGQVIARVGSTGYSTGNHCHFEVRINGAHTDPMKYLGGLKN